MSISNAHIYNEIRSQFSNEFHIKEYLGSGGFGVVIHAINKETSKSYALKILKTDNILKNDIETFNREAIILSSLNHPNIVKFEGIKQIDKRIILIMELVKGGALKKLIKKRKKTNNWFTDLESSIIMKKIFEAVSYMHSHGVIHRDLKPDNILVEDINDFNTIKIADFGVSAQFSSTSEQTFTKKCGTMLYMAPELLFHPYYSKPVDIWSCGIILYILCSKGKHPLYKKNETNQEYFDKLKYPIWNFDDDFDPLAKSLFLRLVSIEAYERYSAEEALNHPWITRRITEEIPWTANEFFDYFHLEQKLLNLMKAIFILEYIKNRSYIYSTRFIRHTIPAHKQILNGQRNNSNNSITGKLLNSPNKFVDIKVQKFVDFPQESTIHDEKTNPNTERSDTMVNEVSTNKDSPLRQLPFGYSHSNININFGSKCGSQENIRNIKSNNNIILATMKNSSIIKSIVSTPTISRRPNKPMIATMMFPRTSLRETPNSCVSPNTQKLLKENQESNTVIIHNNEIVSPSFKIRKSQILVKTPSGLRSHSTGIPKNIINDIQAHPKSSVLLESETKINDNHINHHHHQHNLSENKRHIFEGNKRFNYGNHNTLYNNGGGNSGHCTFFGFNHSPNEKKPGSSIKPLESLSNITLKKFPKSKIDSYFKLNDEPLDDSKTPSINGEYLFKLPISTQYPKSNNNNHNITSIIASITNNITPTIPALSSPPLTTTKSINHYQNVIKKVKNNNEIKPMMLRSTPSKLNNHI